MSNIQENFAAEGREPKQAILSADLVVVGGGLAGTCCAIAAAREGLEAALVQDRPVLGGNGSSEVRLWTLGATAHMFNNNRYAREGGVVGELYIENLFRNRQGNPLIFDTIILEKALAEPRLTLLLNTAAYALEKLGPDKIANVSAFNSQNSTRYRLDAPLFCDASGDGLIAFMSGAAFRMGAESAEEFGEPFAPDAAFGSLLGHSIFFYTKDVGEPVPFVAPSFALKDIESKIPRYRNFKLKDQGCRLWWIEYGGRLDTVHQTEEIKWELWRVVYGVWDYMKNSGKFPEARNLTLEWVGHVPGKRESRRFEGDCWLRQRDIVDQVEHPDVVAYGGWSIDHHPADGVYSDMRGSRHGHAKGVYGIPWRCFYSKNIENLFLAGRIISASHVAFGSTRVMATCAVGGEAVGAAAAICRKRGITPREIGGDGPIQTLQQRLLLNGAYLPQVPLAPNGDLAGQATISASSEYPFQSLPAGSDLEELRESRAQMLPVSAGPLPKLTFHGVGNEPRTVPVCIKKSANAKNFTPEIILWQGIAEFTGSGMDEPLVIDSGISIDEPGFIYICFDATPGVALRLSDQRVSATLSLRHSGKHEFNEDQGLHGFDRWLPARRPEGKNLAFEADQPLAPFPAHNAVNGFARPTRGANCWLASLEDPEPALSLQWDHPQTIKRIHLFFDPDYDHAMETVLWEHPENVVPFTVRHFRIEDDDGNILFEDRHNHDGWRIVEWPEAVATTRIVIKTLSCWGNAPPGLFEVRCFQD